MENFKILIIDDDPQVIASIAEVLEEYKVLASPNGEKGFEVALNSKPDLILLDWEMPELNGIETLKKLKEETQTKDILVIMITGIMTSIQNLKEALDAGAIDFIRKPVDAVELIARTNSMLMLADSYKQSIKLKDWELMLQAKNLKQKNEFISKILSKLNRLNKNSNYGNEDGKILLKELIFELDYNIKGQTWQAFETYFKSVNPRFIDNLINRHPSISPNEIKLCMLLKLNLDTKEIASNTFQNTHSVNVARYRLRKKMNLARKDNLVSYLMTM